MSRAVAAIQGATASGGARPRRDGGDRGRKRGDRFPIAVRGDRDLAGQAWPRCGVLPCEARVELTAQPLGDLDEQTARFDIQGTRRYGAGANRNRSFDREVAAVQLSPQPAGIEDTGLERQRPRETRECQLPVRLDDVDVVQVDLRGRVARSGRPRNTHLEGCLAADSRGHHPEKRQRRCVPSARNSPSVPGRSPIAPEAVRNERGPFQSSAPTSSRP